MTRNRFAIGLALLVTLPLVAAFAGGWATITVKSLPEYLIASQPANLTFSLRQHGMALLPDRSPIVHASNGSTEVTARAVQTNRPGYYTATLNVPTTGDWTVTIKSGFGRSNVTLLPIPAVNSAGRTPVVLSDNERGRHLFVAKGCLSCHAHARVPGSGTYDVGPNLTDRGMDSGYLARFLADPSVKTAWTSNSRMPDLDLEKNEIAALIAFLNGSASKSPVKAAN